MNRHRYEDIVFDGSFLFAERGKEEHLKFTRHERALLQLFTGNANKLLRREQILDAISHAGSDISDRNVDFLVNRLRTRVPDIGVVVGRWSCEDSDADAEGIKGTDGVDLTPGGTRKRLADLLPVLAAQQEKEAKREVAAIGTAGA